MKGREAMESLRGGRYQGGGGGRKDEQEAFLIANRSKSEVYRYRHSVLRHSERRRSNRGKRRTTIKQKMPGSSYGSTQPKTPKPGRGNGKHCYLAHVEHFIKEVEKSGLTHPQECAKESCLPPRVQKPKPRVKRTAAEEFLAMGDPEESTRNLMESQRAHKLPMTPFLDPNSSKLETIQRCVNRQGHQFWHIHTVLSIH